MVCTFFGNRDTPDSIRPKLEELLRALIEQQGVTQFYVGHQGSFDRMVESMLKALKKEYPHIHYSVVLAYLPLSAKADDMIDYSETIFPDGMEKSPPRFAIDKRNRWMIQKSDIAITYVRNPFGNAAKYKAIAERKRLQIIELAN